MAKDAPIAISRQDGIATITLNCPERRNSLGREAVVVLHRTIDEADRDDEVRAIVITGAGSAFSVGADLSGGAETFQTPTRTEQAPHDDRGQGSLDDRDLGGWLALRIFECGKPVIAAVNGVAAGLGATMLLPMDVRIAVDTARFGFVFARRGIIPEACSTWFLPRVVGISRAMDWMTSGRIVDAAEAVESGLIRSLHSPDDLLPAAYAAARAMTEQSAPVSVALVRRLLWDGLTVGHPRDVHPVESSLIRALASHPDAHEGIRSFIEKRSPRFVGRPGAETRTLLDDARA
ncbi:Enoyl-CoA hydratase/isomerase [Parafrankia sp. EAN1pec]|uniref:enoyl-CoA hydratase-related protein n=1 Tax=Parafrankia sp. (strain EAN1pec) TaxID=298653 RepID=UPI0000543523|nr:Enoyl-CoA hydratase/isomerase [Frankia sp. EAN1pec]